MLAPVIVELARYVLTNMPVRGRPLHGAKSFALHNIQHVKRDTWNAAQHAKDAIFACKPPLHTAELVVRAAPVRMST